MILMTQAWVSVSYWHPLTTFNTSDRVKLPYYFPDHSGDQFPWKGQLYENPEFMQGLSSSSLLSYTQNHTFWILDSRTLVLITYDTHPGPKCWGPSQHPSDLIMLILILLYSWDLWTPFLSFEFTLCPTVCYIFSAYIRHEIKNYGEYLS